MRANIRTETVATEQNITTEQRVPFSFENQSLGQTHEFVTVLCEPLFELFLFNLPFLETKVAPDELLPDNQARIGRENHVRHFFARRDQLDLTAQRLKRLAELLPLSLRHRRQGILGAVHPRIDLVFNAVVVRRTEQYLSHESTL